MNQRLSIKTLFTLKVSNIATEFIIAKLPYDLISGACQASCRLIHAANC